MPKVNLIEKHIINKEIMWLAYWEKKKGILTFWKTVKSFLAEKSKKVSKITLIEDNQIISQDKQIAKIFNEYFISIPILNMPTNQEFEYSDSPEEDPPLIIIGKYQSRPS